MRSLTEPPGFRCSHFTRTGTGRPAPIRTSWTRGVPPISSRMVRTPASYRSIGVVREDLAPELVEDGLALPQRLDIALGRHERPGLVGVVAAVGAADLDVGVVEVEALRVQGL